MRTIELQQIYCDRRNFFCAANRGRELPGFPEQETKHLQRIRALFRSFYTIHLSACFHILVCLILVMYLILFCGLIKAEGVDEWQLLAKSRVPSLIGSRCLQTYLLQQKLF